MQIKIAQSKYIKSDLEQAAANQWRPQSAQAGQGTSNIIGTCWSKTKEAARRLEATRKPKANQREPKLWTKEAGAPQSQPKQKVQAKRNQG